MNWLKNHHEKLGWLISWVTLKSIKVLCLCLVIAVISSFVIEAYTEDIMSEVWSAFETQYEVDKENLFQQYGIIDKEMIQFDDEKAQPVNI